MVRTQTTSAAAPEGKIGSQPFRSEPDGAPDIEPPAPEAPGDASELPVANLAAVAQANAALIDGLEAMGAALYAYGRAAFSSATSAARSMIDARSLTDVVAVNHDFAQTALEALISTSARVAEIGAKATGEALRPLGAHVAETLSKMNRPPKH
jgi:phasin family protein